MNYQLSICIATRNRAAFIGETLESIAQQNDCQVQVIILDGASTDNTSEVVAEYQRRLPNLTYQRRETNGGVDRDYDFAVQQATGNYCWLLSDDDPLRPGAIQKILSTCARSPSLIIVNAELRNIDLTEIIDPRRLQIASDRDYAADQLAQIFLDAVGYLSYIGAVVIKREIWMSREREPYFGSYFIHLGVIFQSALPGITAVISEPLISIRFGNTQWRPKEFEIRVIRWTELIWALPAISDQVRLRQYRREPWRSPKSLLFYRGKGTYDIDEYRRWLRPRMRTRLDKLTAWTIARVPGPIANLAGLIFCRLPYPDSNVHLLDMRASRFYYKNLFRRE